ncbi:hypothetical protein AB0764_12135 [Priestia megaterium]|uniref:hypothetical protein n=1 Tax=Priestia megaterium TaxID=1404 RepID=UPI003877CDE8
MRYLTDTLRGLLILTIFIVSSIILDFMLFKSLKSMVILTYAMCLEIYMLFWIYIYVFLFKQYLKPKANSSIYNWLDNTDNSSLFIRDLLDDIPAKDFMFNLEKTYNSILVYANHDVKKLKMLRAYMRSISTESSWQAFNRVLLQLLAGPVIVLLINKGIISKIVDTKNLELINPNFIYTLNFITIGAVLSFIIFIVTTELFSNKKRNKLIEEIIDACIEDLR